MVTFHLFLCIIYPFPWVKNIRRTNASYGCHLLGNPAACPAAPAAGYAPVVLGAGTCHGAADALHAALLFPHDIGDGKDHQSDDDRRNDEIDHTDTSF